MCTTILSAQIATTAVSPAIRNGYAFENSDELWQFTKSNIEDYHFVFFNNNQDFAEDSLQVVKAQELPKDFKYQLVTKAERQDRASQQRVRKFDPFSNSESLVRPARLWGPSKHEPKDNPY